MTRLRLRVADRLKGAQNTYAMLSTFNEVDMTSLMELRSQYKVRSPRRRFGHEGLQSLDPMYRKAVGCPATWAHICARRGPHV